MTIRTPKPKFRKPAPPSKDQLVKEIASLKAGTVDQASKIYELMQGNATLLGRIEQYQEIITDKDFVINNLESRGRDLYRDLMRITLHRDAAEEGREFLVRVVKRLALEKAIQHLRAERYLTLMDRTLAAGEFWRDRAEQPIWRQLYDRIREWRR